MHYKKTLIFLVIIVLFSNNIFAQTKSPYKTSFKKDVPLLIGGLGLSYLGVTLIKNKNQLTIDEVNSKRKEDVFFLDRFSAGNYREKADKDSYIPFYASFAIAPVVGLIEKNQRSNYGQVSLMFIETMSVAAASFTLAAGLIERSRPLVYNTNLPIAVRQDKDEQRSFFAGHVTATAAATFFAAKVYNDFNPDSKLKPYVWTAAAIVPAVVGYQRLRAGKHFLTDNLLGFGVGAACSIIIPELHKSDKIDVSPVIGNNIQGIGLTYTFKN